MYDENPATLSVANADFVTGQLAVGGDLDLRDDAGAIAQVLDLWDAGITHVLDVRLECSDELVWGDVPDVEYRWDGIDDAGQRVPAAWFDRIVDWALGVLEDPTAKLLTHCHMGVNRGPSAGYAVLLGQGWDPVEALDAIRTARPIAYVAYAKDALRWHHRRTGATAEQRHRDLSAVADWRRTHHLDLAGVIRQVRIKETS